MIGTHPCAGPSCEGRTDDVTDSAGTPPEPDPPAGVSGPGTPAGDGPSKRGASGKGRPSGSGGRSGKGGRKRRKRPARPAGPVLPPVAAPAGPAGPAGRRPARFRPRGLRVLAFVGALVVLVAAGVGWWLYKKLDENITTDLSAAAELERYERERPSSLVRGARNILLIGSDTRAGSGNAQYGRDKGTQRSDTTILLHLAAHGRGVTAVSVPRDLMVWIPSCRTRGGSRTTPQFAQFNWAFERGGTACTVRTLEKLTGIRVDHHVVIDFRGFKKMVDAVGGVRVCVRKPVNDPDARVNLKAGARTLDGEQALGYVRARKSLGNGSDTERMDRQQQFLGALVNKVQSNGVLLNPARLYPVLDAATRSVTTDPGLDSLKDLYDLSRAMRSVPTEKVQFLTIPRRPYRDNPNRDELVQPRANSLFKRLRDDEPVVVVPGDGQNETGSGESSRRKRRTSPSSTPTFTGTNAAVGTCS
ncbi:LytR family transcriptional regulator [Streptomyces sp. WAC05374]|uniref:LCP family protein n=1 Tax=Streptomyces sp. WAC05374 TaxID=2487420 RepID=UPI000F8906C0|nr:LytR family transcriptional regulator [Streptomyces sp. WAC05374]TDF46938.1 LytR family transcriptional regulator [Streptomyces sp. WAC05374]TDF57194.1 LytR family transcriptional regulator [Streptomyces sp. WAC05374]TDF61297.1 LytR family transcriptional regulator [Streptomyces sp. WAC05374]